jgi:hypothetical protein
MKLKRATMGSCRSRRMPDRFRDAASLLKWSSQEFQNCIKVGKDI